MNDRPTDEDVRGFIKKLHLKLTLVIPNVRSKGFLSASFGVLRSGARGCGSPPPPPPPPHRPRAVGRVKGENQG